MENVRKSPVMENPTNSDSPSGSRSPAVIRGPSTSRGVSFAASPDVSASGAQQITSSPGLHRPDLHLLPNIIETNQNKKVSN